MTTAPVGRKGSLLPVAIMALILVAILVVAYFLVFLNPTGDQLKDQPRCKMAGHSFLNPAEGPTTKNGGGWDISLDTVTGPDVPLEELVFAAKSPTDGITPAQVWKLNVKGQGENATDLTSDGWSLRAGSRANATFRYANGAVPVRLNATTASSLREDQFHTIEGAVLLFFDTDRDGKLSNGDRILAYKDVNGDGSTELRPGTLLQVQTTGRKVVAEGKLV